ncbi:MAG TPA: FAD-dependent monooxygenase [Bryobacteraceae bacterium]|nr:FAD-dependent monooxygenase [Bryobacteraceae bacterium]
MIETDVLIVGSGPAGSSAGLMLSTYGIPNLIVTKYGWLADTPRAHLTNQRTMEILRDLGIEAEAVAQATPQHLLGHTAFCTSLAGEELGRLQTFGTDPRSRANHQLASPCSTCDLPQNLLEPILLGAAATRGTKVRFDTEYLSSQQDADGVTAELRDRVSGQSYRIRAKYLLGADGSRSKVAEDASLPMEGKMGVAGSINIVFRADLAKYVEYRPSVLYWVLQPGSDIGGVGMGVIRMVRPWHEWLAIWGYDINAGEPQLDDAAAEGIVRNLIGDPDVPIQIRSTSLWTVNDLYATRYSNGRVFCMGDAVHRHPPMNGLGSNTSIQDSYNLAWKLALVLKGKASPSLLDTYNEERAPIGRQIVKRANKSIEETGPIFEALGLHDTTEAAQMRRNMEARKANTPDAAIQREKLRKAIAHKCYEFNTHGVEMNQRYCSAAVVPDGTPEPLFDRDAELHYHPTTWPGARLPHVWLQKNGRPISTLDVAGKGRFAVLTGIGGEGWVEAARKVSATYGVEIAAVVIGPGRDLTDLYGEWANAREIAESGCVLVRPDAHVGWRAAECGDEENRLAEAVGRILGR